MVRQRSRTDIQTEMKIEEFAAQAEQPPAQPRAQSESQPLAQVTELPQAKAQPRTEPRTQTKASAKVKPSPDMADWKHRNREPKSGGINFRASGSQLDLLREAAMIEEISQQKVLERLVWPILEERYGSGQTAK